MKAWGESGTGKRGTNGWGRGASVILSTVKIHFKIKLKK